ncbi:MAG: glycosyltransferase [Candidatus Saganbacteria bacterium]|nr:glycosyltransferase [Candidatus Saganbacteria bacterium]
MKVLYVAHGDYWGSTWPYAFIDHYIINSLKSMGHEVRPFNVFAQALTMADFYKRLAKEKNLSQNQLINILDDRACAGIPFEILDYQPDLLLHIVGRIPERVLKAIKKTKVKTAIWYLDDPQEIATTSKDGLLYDSVYTVEPNCVAAHKKAEFLPLGCFTPIFKPTQVEDKYKSDICFVGVPFPRRVEFFDGLADYLKDYNVKIIGGGPNVGSSDDPWLWKRKLKRLDVLDKFITDEIVFPEEAAKYYNGAKININIHRHPQDSRFSHGNPEKIMPAGVSGRTFAIAGCGGFQLIDNLRSNLGKQFDVGAEIVSFENIDDFKKKVKYYLEHEEERKKIAEAGQKRAYSEHTYEKRIGRILERIL